MTFKGFFLFLFLGVCVEEEGAINGFRLLDKAIISTLDDGKLKNLLYYLLQLPTVEY